MKSEVFNDRNDLGADTLLRLDGGSTDVGQGGNGGMLTQFGVLGGFFCPDVQTGSPNLTGVQRPCSVRE